MTTDSDIIRRSADSPDVFAVLFDRHASDIESFLRRRLGADAAEDALSDTFLIAFHRRGSFDHAWSSARPWLFGIATHVAAKHRTAEARHWRAVEAAAARGEFTTGGGIEEATGRLDAAATIRDMAPEIAALSKRDRETLLLVAWSHLTPEEVATALGIPVGTVWSRLHRIRRKLTPRHRVPVTESWVGMEADDGLVEAAI